MIGTRWFGAVLGTALFAILLYLEFLPHMGPPPGAAMPDGPPPPKAVFGAMFAALPPKVVIWMHFQDLIMGATLLFVLWRKEAQVYAAAIIANHLFLFAAMPFIPIEKLDLGLAALSHVIWLIPLFVFVMAWRGLDKATGYGTWVTLAIAQITVSLFFDIPDAIAFVNKLVS